MQDGKRGWPPLLGVAAALLSLAHCPAAGAAADPSNPAGAYPASAALAAVSAQCADRRATRFIANNLEFRFSGDAGFQIRHVNAWLNANDPSRPIVMDDPESFRVDVSNGEISMTGANLAALLNRELSDAHAPIRNTQIKVVKNGLQIVGELLRGKSWLPMTLTGRLMLDDAATLGFEADNILIDGVEVAPSLHVARLTIQSIVPLHTRSISLRDNRIVIRVMSMLPPPQFRFSIQAISQTGERIVMTLGPNLGSRSASNPATSAAAGVNAAPHANAKAGADACGEPPLASIATGLISDPARSYLLLSGGDIRVERVLARDTTLAFSSADASETLTFSLYDYRTLLQRCNVRLGTDGSVSIIKRPDADRQARGLQ
ncbi:hypothetical protein [Burkholderia sp. TSV86]|uniref:hypothetical protein n=1 Tax=Burkholderia sp. TSV86 TaxID=1385594 RepID=UPI00075D6831|nr:hypothetical protein [Burkholderia sp. TSV86]KVE36430.1 hypothetical protein WS68_00370 [Burkholderia sp. TSV86]